MHSRKCRQYAKDESEWGRGEERTRAKVTEIRQDMTCLGLRLHLAVVVPCTRCYTAHHVDPTMDVFPSGFSLET